MPRRSSLVHASIWGGALALCLPGVVGCGGGAGGAADSGDTFIAYSADFEGYQSWRSFAFDSPMSSGASHIAGPRTVYLNHVPATGATKFPVGTIIVKVTSDGRTFARVKRGGGFNAAYGVPDWEWFELVEKNGITAINWRGYGPPKGEAYGGDPTAGCNACHGLAAATDYVLSPALAAMLAVDAGAPGADGEARPSDSGTDAGVDANSNPGVDADTETDSNDASPE